MEYKLSKEPFFNYETFRVAIDSWKEAGAATVVIEWSTGPGPTLYYYPAGDRRFGKKWTEKVPTVLYNELYADYIEYTIVPKMKEIIAARELQTRVICADQQPILVMRMRRREIEHAQKVAHAH